MDKKKEFKDFLKKIRQHRKENYWDVSFDPDIDLDHFENAILTDFCNKKDVVNKGRVTFSNKNISIEAHEFSRENTAIDKSILIQKIDFDCCDFYGNNGGKKITIKDCKFHKCYFSFSVFNDINFMNCKFESCSFSQAKFYRCIFDASCTFYNISISGGKTKFINTEINPIGLFKKIYKPFEDKPESYKGKDINKERYLLARSIVKLSRNILESNHSCSNDDLYYLSLKNLHLVKLEEKKLYNASKISDIRENIKRKKLDCGSRENKEKRYIFTNKIKAWFFTFKKPAYFFEDKVIKLFGFMNSWGGSLQRLFFIGFSILVFYCLIYMCMDNGSVNYMVSDSRISVVHAEKWYYFLSSLIKSFDVTFLAGYTKHISNSDGLLKQYVLLSNMLLGLFWYAVAIPSLINKISVTRL